VVVKAAHDARRSVLEAFLADALLRARAVAGKRATPAAVVAAPLLSDSMAKMLRDYAATYVGGGVYGFLDTSGRLELLGPGVHLERAPAEGRPGVAGLQAQVDVFSDLNQWLLKVLLAPRLPAQLLGGPHHPVRNATQLAAAAAVSVPHAFRFVEKLRAEGFLEERSRQLTLVRTETLLRRWQAANSNPRTELPCRWVLPGRDLDEALRHHGGHLGARVCVGLFAACHRLGFGLVHGVPDHLYVEAPFERVTDALGLIAARPGEPVEVVLRRPRWREAVFRGVVQAGAKGRMAPVADVVQCWLDLVDEPARGAEQAEELWSRTIAPHLRGES
jgi:hypothetical protein